MQKIICIEEKTATEDQSNRRQCTFYVHTVCDSKTSIKRLLLCIIQFMPSVLTNCSLQRTNTENWKQIFPEKELRGHSPNFQIHVSVSDLYISTIDPPFLQQEICGPILGIYKSLTDRNWD
jgi:hypothetical protein